MWMSIQEPYLLTVRQDDFFPNPRREDENFGTMICFHRRYQLGDEHEYFSSDDLLEELFINASGGGDKGKQMYDNFVDSFDLHPGTMVKIQAYNRALMAEIEKSYVVLPVYLLDHSGLSVSTTDFNDPWDSGQTGRTASATAMSFIKTARSWIAAGAFPELLIRRVRILPNISPMATEV